MNHEETYLQRNSGVNKAEILFEMYCGSKGLKFNRFGFDEKNESVENFYKLHPLIRSLPDYVVTQKDKILYVHVKGTNKIKLDDLLNYSAFESLFCHKGVKLYIAFCFDEKILFKSLDWLKEQLPGTAIKRFDIDNKIYFDLKF